MVNILIGRSVWAWVWREMGVNETISAPRSVVRYGVTSNYRMMHCGTVEVCSSGVEYLLSELWHYDGLKMEVDWNIQYIETPFTLNIIVVLLHYRL